MFTKLDNIFDYFTEKGLPGFDCMIMKDGEVVYRRMGGFSDYEGTVPVNGKERYNIYSCSKVITCVAALQLLEKGKYRLTDKLSDYLPEFENMTVKTADGIKPAKNPILIKDLFCMTSGFDYGVAWPVKDRLFDETKGSCPTREFVRELAKSPLLFEPGERWEYGVSHDILACFVEVVAEERFGEYVRKNIFEPLGMNNSTFLLDDSELDSICAQYRYNDETKEFESVGKAVVTYKFGSLYESGGAGCISTVEDYMKFLEALRIGDIILKKETIALMSTNMLSEGQSQTYWRTATHGYGLGVRTPKDGYSFDFGWGGAAGAYLVVDPTHNVTFYYAQHVLSSPFGQERDSFYRIISEIFSGQTVPVSKLPDEVLQKYL